MFFRQKKNRSGVVSVQVIDKSSGKYRLVKTIGSSSDAAVVAELVNRVQRRIEAHICIAFAAYKVYKELERQLKDKKSTLSPEKAIEIAKTIFSVQVKLNESGESVSKTIYTRAEQKNLANLFGF